MSFFSSDKQPVKRSRNGCLTCRERKQKCDESQPVCDNCFISKRRCQWGIKASFHKSRMLLLDPEESRNLAAVTAMRSVTTSELQLIDKTSEIAEHYRISRSRSPSAESPSYAIADPDLSSYETIQASTHHDETDPGSSVAVDQAPPRADHDSSADQSQEPQRESWTSSRALRDTLDSFSRARPCPFSSQHDSLTTVTSQTRAELLQIYLRETSAWCENTDSMRSFSSKESPALLKSTIFVAAAMALASRHLELKTSVGSDSSLKLYQESISLLIQRANEDADEFVLASCLMLCVFEMIDSPVTEWRRHLQGCAQIISSKNWNGSYQGLVGACFWPFVRIDIWAAFLTSQKTLIPTKEWIDSSYADQAELPLVDRYANTVTLILAKVINILSEYGCLVANGIVVSKVHGPEEQTSLQCFLGKLQRWSQSRPLNMLPVLTIAATEMSPFATSVYASPSAECGNILYHTASLLLLQSGVHPVLVDGRTPNSDDVHWHANQICSISMSSTTHANWINNVQPLFIAGKFIREPAAQVALLKHLTAIQNATGWQCKKRAEDLRRLWGWE